VFANVSNGTLCDLDANACTLDTCQGGTCTAGGAASCDDSSECTADSCDSVSGCVHTNVANGTSCGGGSGTCQNGVCASNNCTTYQDSLGSGNNNDYYELGTVAANKVITVNLSCPLNPNVDFDIYLQRRTTWGWSTVASSLGLTCDELIKYTSPNSRTYRVRVYRYSGSGQYTLKICIQ
jgi:hypothetical protein